MGQIDIKNISSLDSIEIEKEIEQQIQEIVHQELEERTINHSSPVTVKDPESGFLIVNGS